MKLSKLVKTLLVLGAIATMVTSARAAVTTDLILGFRVEDQSGATFGNNNLYIDLGTATNLVAAANANGGTINLSNYLNATDLTTVFGSSWNNYASYGTVAISWSVAEAPTSGFHNVYITNPNNNLTFSPASSTTQNAPYTAIQSLVKGTITLTGSNATEIQNASTTAGSYTQKVSTGVGEYNYAPFQSASNTTAGNIENQIVNSGSAVSYLDEIQSLTGGDQIIQEGYFTLSNNGNSNNVTLTFTTIPEPSTYAMFGLGALGLVFLARRRSVIA